MSAHEVAASPSAADALTTQEKLLFAQAVYKVGAAAWTVIAELLTSHPLSEMNGKIFTPELSEAIYVDLMTSTGQNV
jgi:bromodomain-containing protein 8